MKTWVLYLYPRSSISSMISSDTLFGAICWGISILRLKPSVPELLTRPQRPFLCSGLYPMLRGQNEFIRFYPRPVTFDLDPQDVQEISLRHNSSKESDKKDLILNLVAHAKKIKKATYLSEELIRQVAEKQLSAPHIIESWLQNDRQKAYLLYGNKLLTPKEAKESRVSQSNSRGWGEIPLASQRTQINRLSGAAAENMLFLESEYFFSKGSGLWAVFKANDDEMRSWVIPALRYLADSGLGANRTSGKGHFCFEIEEWNGLPDGGEKSNAFMALSRFLPGQNELAQNPPLAYRLANLWAKREKQFPHSYTGHSSSAPIYKKRLRVFEPGSVFSCSARQEYFGRTALVVEADEPDGPVYQSGLCIPLYLQSHPEGETP